MKTPGTLHHQQLRVQNFWPVLKLDRIRLHAPKPGRKAAGRDPKNKAAVWKFVPPIALK